MSVELSGARTKLGRTGRRSLLVWVLLLSAGRLAAQQSPEGRRAFHVKYVVEESVYLDGGQNAGLAREMKLTVKRPDPDNAGGFLNVAELVVMAVASSSAVCEVVHAATGATSIQRGDTAYLSGQDEQALEAEQGALERRKYPQVVTFTEGDPLDEEQRAEVPRPPLPEINRKRGLVGMEFGTIRSLGGGPSSFEVGTVMRMDMTRIGGSYWNFTGYYRGRINSAGAGTANTTVLDLVSRTYQLGFTYVNPHSPWVMGVGRLYLPWAVSLGTIDGGYFGYRAGRKVAVGLFGGSTPDPAVWNYTPHRQIAGTFANVESGNFDSAHFAGTAGIGVTRIYWNRERDFLFTDMNFSYKRIVSVYESLQADLMPPDTASTATSAGTGASTAPAIPAGPRTPGLTQSFLTVRVQPNPHVEFSVTDNYFRNPPSFDPRLIGTGLVEQYLFEGISGGVRVRLPYTLEVYTSLGRSTRTGDTSAALNQLYGVAMGNIWHTGLRADAHYSTFDSSYGRGHYGAFSLSRQFGETLRAEVQIGQQGFISSLTQSNNAWWIYSNLDWFVGQHTYLGAGFTSYQGGTAPYAQIYITTGYRF